MGVTERLSFLCYFKLKAMWDFPSKCICPTEGAFSSALILLREITVPSVATATAMVFSLWVSKGILKSVLKTAGEHNNICIQYIQETVSLRNIQLSKL